MRDPRPYTHIGILIAGGETHVARAKVLAALHDARGSVKNSAENLGVSLRSLERWLDRLELREDLGKIREKFRKPKEPRRPARKVPKILPPPSPTPPIYLGQLLDNESE